MTQTRVPLDSKISLRLSHGGLWRRWPLAVSCVRPALHTTITPWYKLLLAITVISACGPHQADDGVGQGESRSRDSLAQERVRAVAVTIDDLPAVSAGPERDSWERTTAGILEALRQHDAPAIGFVNESKLYDDGRLVSTRVDLLTRWLSAGHELGNHTFSHPKLYDTPLEDFFRDVMRGEEITRRLVDSAGSSLEFFRHPFLNTGRSIEQRDRLNRLLADNGYRVAPVTIDNYDYEFARAYERALSRHDSTAMTRIGNTYVDYMLAVIEFYEGQSMQIVGYELPQILLIHANRLNAEWLEPLLDAVANRGYEFVTVANALQDSAYALPDTVVTQFGFSWLHRWAITADMDRSIFRGEPAVPEWITDQRQ